MPGGASPLLPGLSVGLTLVTLVALKSNTERTTFIPTSTFVSPTSNPALNPADGFQNAAVASAFAFAVAPAAAVPMLDAPCSRVWNPAANIVV